MHLVPAPAVKLMKSRVLSRPGMKKCLGGYCWILMNYYKVKRKRKKKKDKRKNERDKDFL
jgi:hypothetical protein